MVEDSPNALWNVRSPFGSDQEEYWRIEENAQLLYIALEPLVKVVLRLRPIRVYNKIGVFAESAPFGLARSLVETGNLSYRLPMAFDDDGFSRFNLSQELGKPILRLGCADRHFYILAISLARMHPGIDT